MLFPQEGLYPVAGGLSKTFCTNDHSIDFCIDRILSLTHASDSDGSVLEHSKYVHEKVQTGGDIDSYAQLDDRCQIYQIGRKHSFSRIGITQDMFKDLCSAYNIFPALWDFVVPFGFKSRNLDIGQAACKIREVMSISSVTSFECAYTFHHVQMNGRNHLGAENEYYDPWSIRPTAVYQQYDSITNRVMMLIVAPAEHLQGEITAHMQQTVHNDQAIKVFEIHLIILSSLHDNWASYLRDLGDEVKRQSGSVVLTQTGVGTSFPTDTKRNCSFLDRQRLSLLSDKVLDLEIVFESLIDTTQKILETCSIYCKNNLCSDCQCSTVLKLLQRLQDDTCLNLKKARILHQRIESAEKLIANLLEFENATMAHSQVQLLAHLTSETKGENFKMMILAERSARDAAAVRILTIITLIYLPMTVVASFFSSQLIHVNDRGEVSVVAGAWWFAVVSIPLTLITFLLWRYSLHHSLKARDQKMRTASSIGMLALEQRSPQRGFRGFSSSISTSLSFFGNKKREKMKDGDVA